MKAKQLGLSTLAAVLLILVILILLGALPLGWPAYGPPSLLVIALVIVIVLAVMGKL